MFYRGKYKIYRNFYLILMSNICIYHRVLLNAITQWRSQEG